MRKLLSVGLPQLRQNMVVSEYCRPQYRQSLDIYALLLFLSSHSDSSNSIAEWGTSSPCHPLLVLLAFRASALTKRVLEPVHGVPVTPPATPSSSSRQQEKHGSMNSSCGHAETELRM